MPQLSQNDSFTISASKPKNYLFIYTLHVHHVFKKYKKLHANYSILMKTVECNK